MEEQRNVQAGISAIDHVIHSRSRRPGVYEKVYTMEEKMITNSTQAIKQFKRYHSDHSDPWGSIMVFAFDFCEYVTYFKKCSPKLSEIIYDDMGFFTPFPRLPETDAYVDLFEDLSTAELEKLAQWLSDTIDAIPENERY
jgi:hypothetical protein